MFSQVGAAKHRALKHATLHAEGAAASLDLHRYTLYSSKNTIVYNAQSYTNDTTHLKIIITCYPTDPLKYYFSEH